MINEDSIYTTIRKFVSDKIDAGIGVRHDWVATEFMMLHCRIDGDDAEIYRYCTRLKVQEFARKCIAKYGANEAAVVDEQTLLPGFERLQRAYPVERDGHHITIPIHQCTNEELMARATEYDEMAKGCRIHAKEIRAYVRKRKGEQAA
jgi:hypothetical protein